MIRVFIDEDFNHDILRGVLRRLPILDAVTAQELGRKRKPDPGHLALATDRIIITPDETSVPRKGFSPESVCASCARLVYGRRVRRWNEADGVPPVGGVRLLVDPAELLNYFAKTGESPTQVGRTNQKEPWHGFAALDSLAGKDAHGGLVLRYDDSLLSGRKGEDLVILSRRQADVLHTKHVKRRGLAFEASEERGREVRVEEELNRHAGGA